MNSPCVDILMLGHGQPFYQAVSQAVADMPVTLRHAESVQETLEAMESYRSHIVLLDAETPDMDVLSVCQTIRQEYDSQGVEVLILSIDDSTGARIAAYEAGADDYFCIKPLHTDELLRKTIEPLLADELRRKIGIAIRRREKHRQLNDFAQMASQTAMMAMSNAGELGVLLQFLKKSFECHGYAELGEAIVEALVQYGLVTTVRIWPDGEVARCFASGGAVAPLAETLLDRLRDQGRIVDFNARSVFNYPHVSILVKNMPLDDVERYGRIKDHVAMLAEGSEARILAVQSEVALARQKAALEALISGTYGTLQHIEQTYLQHQAAASSVVEDLLKNLEQLFFSLGLSDEQESTLLELVKEAAERHLALYEEGLRTDELFADILRRLNESGLVGLASETLQAVRPPLAAHPVRQKRTA